MEDIYTPSVKVLNDITDKNVDHNFKTITSYSHMMGSITSIVVDYIKSAFNQKYIKAVWNTLEVPYSQRMKGFKDFMNKPKPIMTIDPRFDPSNETEFMSQSEFDYEGINDPQDNIWKGFYNSMVVSYSNNYLLCTKPRRYKMDFTVNFIFDSDVQRIQCQEFIRQNIRHKFTNTIKRYVENNIPTDFMKAIALTNNLDYESEEFLQFVNRSTRIPITKRIRTGSGNVEFFALEKTPVDILFTSGPNSNGVLKKGELIVSSSFSEEITVEFVAYSMYFLKTNQDVGSVLDKNYIVTDSSTIKGVGIDNLYLLNTPIIPELSDNYMKIITSTIQVDKNGDDTLELLNVMHNPEITSIFKYYKKNSKTVDFLKVIVFENEYELASSRLTLDLNTLKLTIKSMDIYKNYYVNIYIDNNKIADLKTDMFEWDDVNRVQSVIDEKELDT